MNLTEHAAAQLTGDAARWQAPLNRALNIWNINTPERASMFLAQCAHESGGFRRLTESLRYTASALLATWPNRFTPDEANAMAFNEEAIGERAYGGRMGNGPEGTGDGFRYRGRGIIQLTGRENYRKAGQALGLDLEEKPDIVLGPVTAAQSAGWFWSSHGCNELADAGDFEGITRRINGGLNGYAERKSWLAKVRKILAEQPAAPIEDKSTEYTPPASGITEPTKEQPMGAAIPLLASILPSVLQLFSGKAQAQITKATGASPEVAGQFLQSLAANVGAAVGIPVTDNATAMQAVGKFTEAPTPAAVQALEAKAVASVDELLRVADKSSQIDGAYWSAQLAGKDAAAARAKEERWDMTPWLVWFAGLGTSLCSVALLGAIVYQSLSNKIDPVLLGLAGPLLAITYSAWKSIFDYRFDGTKESGEQSRALTDVIRQRGQA